MQRAAMVAFGWHVESTVWVVMVITSMVAHMSRQLHHEKKCMLIPMHTHSGWSRLARLCVLPSRITCGARGAVDANPVGVVSPGIELRLMSNIYIYIYM